MDTSLKILLVEDSEIDADLLARFLNKEKIKFSHIRVWHKDTFIAELKKDSYDLIIADHNLPQFSGMEAFRICKSKNITLPFILLTGSVSEKVLTEYAKEGVDDYILKDNLLRLPSAIQNLLSKKKIEKLNTELSETVKKLNYAYSDIKDSIDYAKLLQDAILPDKSILQDSFPGSFIIFKPKDVLSGDFYWFDKREDVFFVSVADCTGHGVPGSLLAMMGNNLINEAVNLKRLSEPSAILNRINKQVKRVLKQDKTSASDGMDVAFCKIDIKNKTLIYAGANRPLLIERGKKLIEVKPDKISIGGIDERTLQFTSHKIQIEEGDRIFLFSDGYVDQFSDKINKKITIKRLRDILIESAALPINEQKKFITDFFETWKGKHEQIDDVLFMCIVIP
jgi:serine phosphatase RsbU (regulator of sigma subunit)